ncbi:trp operon repressor [Salinivibrio sharmensis]|uniref:Trp operon repressor homolog n=1 Tax=Salinivibrio sharmensis TaxID=390883 RepID=A0ABX3KAZ5_9GAMM|nr:trp operon repressor [Salinivibrio sharmensis]OOE86098.1 Trp operon repressor [Salinivibrio sharmensis]
MSQSPAFSGWQDVIALVRRAGKDDNDDALLTALLTPDERDTLVARINILHELLEGRMSQRQLSQLLGVGIATVTRGSNELKRMDDETKNWLADLLKREAEEPTSST